MFSFRAFWRVAAPLAVGSLVWSAAGCSSGDSGRSGASGSTGSQQRSAAAQLQAFDPPSRFDTTKPVPLTQAGGIFFNKSTKAVSHVQASLSGTTYLSIDAGQLVATDVATGSPIWSTTLVGNHAEPSSATTAVESGPDAPVVAGGVVYAAEVGFQEAQGSSLDSFAVHVVGADLSSGQAAWQASLPFAPDGNAKASASAAALLSTGVTVTEQGVVVQVSRGHGAPDAAWMLDAKTGETLWQVDGVVGASATGRYGVVLTDSRSQVSVLDLQTGQPTTGGPVERTANGVIYPDEILPYAIDGWVTVTMDYQVPSNLYEETPHVEKLNTADGTWVNADSLVIDYHGAIASPMSCAAEPGQTLLLCDIHAFSSSGTQVQDYATGEVVWIADGTTRKALTGAVQFHGYVYGLVGDEPIVIDLATGDDVEVSPGAAPVLVDEYGAVLVDEQGSITWVPAAA